jgi:RimJ/RimL family protein N-acetyltransferase
MIVIREAREEDAEAFLEHCTRLDNETRFMMLEPGERTTTVAQQRRRLRAIGQVDTQTILVADSDGEIAGHIAGFGGRYRRNAKTVHVVIGVLERFRGQGTGSRLLGELESWARSRELRRLELTVMTHNERAIRLYRKMGYETEGTRKDSLFVDGRFADEYAMSRILS